ncbi:YihY/virulence factor BrkB family protein [Microbacterium resistens]|uniref:YihY/virulence factor BrkB family protein n=1 Tax=Microbacterium resistens TaxID=156977 RepID=UPI001E63317C|nr:YihY/virulence factor BrkB family protein [Microbacterium resistens]
MSASAPRDPVPGKPGAVIARLEKPLDRAAALTRRTMAAFPVRVWRHFLRNNGFLLSAGVSYQGLFALFALVYIAFAAAGIWLGGSTEAVDALIGIANGYIPGLISERGLASPADVRQIAQASGGVLGITGAIAVAAVLWTAITAVTFTRRAVRDIFGLGQDPRNAALLKLRDLLAAAAFGFSLLVGAALSLLGVWALTGLFDVLGWSTASWAFGLGVRVGSILVIFLVDALALALLVRFLTGIALPWRTILPGAALGGAAVTVLQLGAGLLLSRTPTNPLLATFAVVIAMLLWCRWVAVVVLVACSWIAVAAADRDQPLEREDETAARRAEQEALVLAAAVRRRRAAEALDAAPWHRRAGARRVLRRAEEEWERAVADAEVSDEAHRRAASRLGDAIG